MEYKQINVSNVLQSINLTLGGVKEGVLYCYIVTASNGTFTIKLEGDFEISKRCSGLCMTFYITYY